jgi:hypothetical protein
VARDGDQHRGPAANRSPPLVVRCRIEGEVGMGEPRWEYRIINCRSENYRLDPHFEMKLNELGDDGWELVSITAINFKTGATDHIGMVFKRPRTSSLDRD